MKGSIVKIFIAVPTYDGRFTANCAESIIHGTHVLRDEGHEVVPYFYAGNPYIAAARNICTYQFLRSDCDEMIFIDADVGFDRGALSQLIKYDKEIVAGVYPYKQDKEGYPCIVYFDPETNNCKEESTGLVTADVVPTGFLRLKRSVFDKMVQFYSMKPTADKFYSFFDTGQLFPDDDTWYGEDVYFCKRWRNMGEMIFIEPRLNFTHAGFKTWKGNYHEYLMGRCVANFTCAADGENDGVQGWTTDGELHLLGELASRSKEIVEIGSWKGRSTKVLLEMCRGKVYAVDHWKGSPSDISSIMATQQDVYQQFLSNVGHYQNLEILRGYSTEVAQKFQDASVDTVFIDADHSYIGCKSDIAAWLPKCRKYICGHDYDCPEVKRAVDEAFGKVNIVERMWWVALGTEKQTANH